MELISEYFMALLLFFSFITLIFYGFPVAWTMGGLAVLFTLISMLSDMYLDTFFGVDWKFASMVVYRLYGVMANWVLVALPMFIFMGIMMDKSGIAEEMCAELIEQALQCKKIKVDGLMTIAPFFPEDPKIARQAFSRLRLLRDKMESDYDITLKELSMGMSGDLDEAIKEGSTMIRVGSALFGKRV